MDKEQMKFNKEVGMRIRDHREFLHYTREQLAEKKRYLYPVSCRYRNRAEKHDCKNAS